MMDDNNKKKPAPQPAWPPYADMLDNRMSVTSIRAMATQMSEMPGGLEDLWKLASEGSRRTSVNALWVMCYLTRNAKARLRLLQDELVDMLLRVTDPGQKRLLLHLLNKQDFAKDHMRSDLLDFCLGKINSECEPYAIRAFCIYLAYKLCRHYQELIGELREHIEMMNQQQLSPGLRCAKKKVEEAMQRISKTPIGEFC